METEDDYPQNRRTLGEHSSNGLKPMGLMAVQCLQRGQITQSKDLDGRPTSSSLLPNDSGDTGQAQTHQAVAVRRTGNELGKTGATQTCQTPKPLFAPVKGILWVKNQATQARSLILQKKPYKCLELNQGKPRTFTLKTIEPDLTAEQSAWLQRQKALAAHSVVMEHLTWLSAHKRMERDVERMTVIKRDWCDLLTQYPEYAIALSVVDLIENDEKEWWSSHKAFADRVRSYVVPDTPLPAQTNAYELALERQGQATATAWFSHCVIEGKTLWCSQPHIGSFVMQHWGHVYSDVFTLHDFARIENA